MVITEERIVTAVMVTTGEKGDGPELPKLIEISRENGLDFDTVIGDEAYSEKKLSNLHKSKTSQSEVPIAGGSGKWEVGGMEVGGMEVLSH